MREHLAKAAKERQEKAGTRGKEGGRGRAKPSAPNGTKGSGDGRVNVELGKKFDIGHGTIAKAQKSRQASEAPGGSRSDY